MPVNNTLEGVEKINHGKKPGNPTDCCGDEWKVGVWGLPLHYGFFQICFSTFSSETSWIRPYLLITIISHWLERIMGDVSFLKRSLLDH